MTTRMRRPILALCFAVLTAVGGCASTPNVFTDFDSSHSFSGYSTFSWISEEPMMVSGDRGPTPIVASRLKSNIVEALEMKGFDFVDERDEADFVVGFTVGARDRLEIRERDVLEFYGPHWRWGYEYYGVVYPRGFPRTEVTTRNYSEGSLAIDIFDGASKSPVWHGSASKRLTRAEMRGQSEESTRMAVQTILAGFPPQ